MNHKFYIDNFLVRNYITYDMKHIGYSEDSLVYHMQNIDMNVDDSTLKKEFIVKCFEDSLETQINKELKTSKDVIGLIQPLNIIPFKINEETTFIFVEYPYYKYDLESYIKLNPDLPFSAKMNIINQIIEGVKYLHSIGLYHGDLKPKNICISEDGQTVKIIDYGLCDELINEDTAFLWKNTIYSASPFQLFRHLQEYPKHYITYYDKYYTILKSKKYSKNVFDVMFQKSDNKTVFKESCVDNDWFGVGLLIYFILSNGTYFFLSTNSTTNTNVEINDIFKNSLDFLQQPRQYCNKAKIEHSELYEPYLLRMFKE